METLIKRITIDADVCHGKPTIRNMRYTVEMIMELLSSGMTWTEITEDYPAIVEDDIRACLLFATQLARVKTMRKVVV
ncbi:MAG: DUF433 domain-containing protein [Bacteroidales bacterium]|nr:DUF433 domain-containing protein [Bacteroidales bacterium]